MKYMTGAPNQSTGFVQAQRLLWAFISIALTVFVFSFPLWAGESLPWFFWVIEAIGIALSCRVTYEYHQQLKTRRCRD